MLHYKFMIVAFFVCLLLGASIPLIGSNAVYKRLSSSGDALAHSSLAGVAIGLASGLNPLWTSILACIVSCLIIEILRKRFNKFSELGVAVVLSASIGLAGILSSFTKASNFDSYLFGSILLISDTELYLTIGLAAVIFVFSFVFYSHNFSSLYSESEARVSGIKVGALTFASNLLLSISVALGAKVVGSLVISSLIVLPSAIALQFKKGYKFTLISSSIIGIITMSVGLTIAYYCDLKPGATMVIVAVGLLIIVFIYRYLKTMIDKTKTIKKI